MWHEARRQERKIRGLMVDFKKRADRRREFYQKIKLDPTQFLRVYGRPYKVHYDPAVAMAAESPQSMMPWQGDSQNMIDRFDVRAHLDVIPEVPPASTTVHLNKEEEEEDRQCNYERYRTLVENEASGLSEEQCLNEIYIDEHFGPPAKPADEEKKKNADKKAAIGYTYEDSTPATGLDDEEDSSDEQSSDTDVETADLDITLDVKLLTPEQEVEINTFAHQYGMKERDFVNMLRQDKEELEALKFAKQMEEEKAQFSGRKSRRERRAFKEKQLQGRRLSPPSYAARSSPKYEPYKRGGSSSRSRSRSPEEVGQVKFITSFGAESDEEGAGGPVLGPSLPPPAPSTNASSAKSDRSSLSARTDSQSDKNGQQSWKNKGRPSNLRQRGRRSRTRSRSRSPAARSSYRSGSRGGGDNSRGQFRRDRRSRSRSRSRSYDRRSSSDYRDREPSDYRGRQPSGGGGDYFGGGDRRAGGYRDRQSGGDYRDYARQGDRDRWGDSRDRGYGDSRDRGYGDFRDRGYGDSRDRPPVVDYRDRPGRYGREEPRRGRYDRDRFSASRNRSRSQSRGNRRSRSNSRASRSDSHSRSRSKSSSRSSSRSRSKSKTKGSPAKSRSRERSEDSTSQPGGAPPIKRYRRDSLSSQSSISQGEEEPLASSSNSLYLRSGGGSSCSLGKSGDLAKGQGKLTPQERLRRRMQAQLNRQYKADKRAENSRMSKIEQERIDREEDLRNRTMEMRRREREKRHKEMAELEKEQRLRGESDSDDDSDDRGSRRRSRRGNTDSDSDSDEAPVSKRPPRYRRSRSRSRSTSSERGGLVSY